MDFTAILDKAQELAARDEEIIPEPAAAPVGTKQTLQNIKVKHLAIMDFMLLNPLAKMSEVAAQFGVTQGWLSIIVHSDAFQAALKEKESQLFLATVVPLRQKVQAAAHIGVEKTAEALVHASAISDKAFIVETTETLLTKLDYGVQKAAPALAPGMQQNNFYIAEKEAVERARDTMRALGRTIEATPVKEGKALDTEKLLNTPT